MPAEPRSRRTPASPAPVRRPPTGQPASRRPPIAQAAEVVGVDTQVELRAPSFPSHYTADESITHMRATPEPPAPQESEMGARSTARASLGTGDRIGRYQIGRKLGHGTFGIVFEALDTQLDRLVALKVLAPAHATDPRIVRRFLQESRAASRVAHPGIVMVLDCGEADGTAYIVMELLQGESLANRLARSGALQSAEAMELGRQVAAALHAAHEMGVVHRDLKPDNIFLVPDPAAPSGERVKVLDFGLAKLHHTGDHTQSNQAFGTPRYMAPEQARSAGDVDRRADIYALGCILFELVCGRAPFEGELFELFEQHQRARAPRARLFAAAVPHALDQLIANMLEKRVAARPATMAIVQRELQAAGALAPGAAATMGPTDAALLMKSMPLAALHAMPSVVVAPVPAPPPPVRHDPMLEARVFGPGTGMIRLPPTPDHPFAVLAVPLPIVDAPPPPRPRRMGLYLAGLAAIVTAIALLTTIALRQADSHDASPAAASVLPISAP